MRMRQNRLTTLWHKKRTVQKNSEGTAKTTYGDPNPVSGYSWSAGGQVQASQYGDSLPYVRNIRLESPYTTNVENGVMHYVLSDGTDIVEKDLMVIDGMDYEIRAIRPERHLYMEVVKI